MTPFEQEVGKLIIDELNLEDVNVDEIDLNAPLFVEGLGLDSIDALELSLAVTRKYGVQIRSDDSSNQNIFASLTSLAQFIDSNRAS